MERALPCWRNGLTSCWATCSQPRPAGKSLPGAGVRGLLLEGESGLTVVLGRLLGVTQAEAQRELDQLLPAHLAWAWEESITWVAWDAYPHPFEEWDGLGLTWAQLDQTVREDLEDYFEEET